MRFEGVFEVRASPEKVFEVVTDPDHIARCMPGLQKLDIKSPEEFDALVKAGAGFIKGDFALHFKIVEKEAPSRAKMIAHGSGLGSVVDIEMSVELREGVERGTTMRWAAEATVSGRIASVGQRLMQSSAEKMVTGFFQCLKDRLEGG